MRVPSGEASRWIGLRKVWLLAGPDLSLEAGEPHDVEAARAYRDRLVLKLRGIADAASAAALRGRWVAVSEEQVPPLPEGEHYTAWLVGLRVVDASGAELGRVVDVDVSGMQHRLVVQSEEGEWLVPLAEALVPEVNEDAGEIRVELPEGLRELNRREER